MDILFKQLIDNMYEIRATLDKVDKKLNNLEEKLTNLEEKINTQKYVDRNVSTYKWKRYYKQKTNL